MITSSLGQAYRQVRQWWRRSFRSQLRSGSRHRPPVVETLETRLVPAGTWTALRNPPLDNIGTMMLLSDGTVMAQGDFANGQIPNASKKWYKLTPDNTGSYINGTWSAMPSMHLERLYYGSNILPDGRIFLVGGEYSGGRGLKNFTNTGEIYDPVANTWTNITPVPTPRIGQPPVSMFGDDPTMVLPDGRVLAGYLLGPQTYIYDPATNSWSAGATKLRHDRSDEETWVKLPDGSVLSYSIFASARDQVLEHFTRQPHPGEAQRYIPSTNQWVATGSVPVELSSGSFFGSGRELGPAFLLPDGRVFQLPGGSRKHHAAIGNTALYTLATNRWEAGPPIPNQLVAGDAPGAMMPNGHVLFAADHMSPGNFDGPTTMFEYDPTAMPDQAYTNVTPSSTLVDLRGPAFPMRMLMLPNGQVLFSNGYRQLLVYAPSGAPNNAWRPTISFVNNNGDGTYTLGGTQLNGISEGATYGDDAEMSTNFPIVRLTSGTRVYYARTFNWTSTGVATGPTNVVATQFSLPANLPEGSYSLAVMANGIASTTVPFTFARATHLGVVVAGGTKGVVSVVAGTALTVTVSALDATNHVIPGYQGTVSFTSNDPQASLPADYTFRATDHGVHTFTVILKTAGIDRITATDADNGLSTTESVSVIPLGLNHLSVTSSVDGSSTVAGAAFDVTVTAQDVYNNTVPTYTGRITFTSNDPHGATLPAAYTFVAADMGSHTFAGAAALYTAGTWNITARDTVGTTASDNINVTSAPAVAFQVMAPDTVVSGMPFDVTVVAVDPYGNTDRSYQGTVTFSSSDQDPGVVLPADYTFQASDAGVHTFTNTGRGETTLITPGDQTITVTDTTDDTITGTAMTTVATTLAPSQRRGFVSLLLAQTPAQPSPVPAAVTTATTDPDHARVDRFFSATASDVGWAVPGLKPPADRQLLLKPQGVDPNNEVLGTNLVLDLMLP